MERIIGIGEMTLGLVFAVAVALKMRVGRNDPMRTVLATFLPTLPPSLVDVARALIMLAELILAYSLVVGVSRSLAIAGAVVLLFAFTCVLVFLSVAHGFDGDCGCFGRSSRPLGVSSSIWRNVFLMIIAAILLAFEAQGIRGTALANMTMWDIGGSMVAFGLLVVTQRFTLGMPSVGRVPGSGSGVLRIGPPHRS